MNIKKEIRPWGSFKQFTHNEVSTVKMITVDPGARLSLQYHEQREEFWVVLKGNPTVTLGEESRKASPGDEFFISKKTKHRLQGNEKEAVVLEISFGNFDENDIVRIEDDFGRT